MSLIYEVASAPQFLTSSSIPNFSLLPKPPYCGTYGNLIESQLTEFKNNLVGFQFAVTALTVPEICAQILQNVQYRIFTTTSPYCLSSTNPIDNVYVNNSRESSDGELWRDGEPQLFAIHPVSSGNGQPGYPYEICVAKRTMPDQSFIYLLADIYAYSL